NEQDVRDILNIWASEINFTIDGSVIRFEKSKGVLVFLSYATADVSIFNIHKLAEGLTQCDGIEDVLYWEEDLDDNIYEYMDKNLGRCDVFILICSPNALNSIPVQKEWRAADALNKPIIPIFMKANHIPPLLSSRLGVKYDLFNFKSNIETIYKLVLKKSGIPETDITTISEHAIAETTVESPSGDSVLIQKFKDIISISHRVKQSQVAKYIGITEEELFPKLIEWGKFLSFKIDDDIIIVNDIEHSEPDKTE
ncbi:MAG: toll/interleukin-1 receptor domain-containing protein, partial [Promethearchaeota archaeon]